MRRVRGEISQPSFPRSGHCYFRLKDENAVIDGVCWKGTIPRLGIRILEAPGQREAAPALLDQLAPGDLVFYYSGISHVGIYAGGGQILHASRPGKPIGYDPLRSMPIAGARAVG